MEYGGDAMSNPTFFKSSFSSGGGGCVEVAFRSDGSVLVRDTKDRGAGTLSFTPVEWSAFLLGVKGGEFDLPMD
jgi:hypothetical protein